MAEIRLVEVVDERKLDNVQHVSNGCPTELELEKDIDIELELEVDSKKTPTDTNIYDYKMMYM